MSTPITCPQCQSENIYQDGPVWICPSCNNEWSHEESSHTESAPDDGIKDAHGNVLQDGDSVTVLKELRVKGSSSVVKVGTKVKNIRIIDGDDGHDIACRIDGLGSINLKSEFVKKV